MLSFLPGRPIDEHELLSFLRLCAAVQLRWNFVEILKQCGTQPPLDVELRAVISIATRSDGVHAVFGSVLTGENRPAPIKPEIPGNDLHDRQARMVRIG